MNTKISLLILSVLVCLWSCKDDIQPTENDTENQTSQVSILLDTITFQKSMKGWELYSWASGSDWNYSLMIGTNRLKSYDEIVNNKVIVQGKENIKILLGKLPENEQILWANVRLPGNFQLPPQSIIDEIKVFCTTKKLTLAILQ